MELEKATGIKGPCWCFQVEFPKELLAQLPEGACICAQCVSDYTLVAVSVLVSQIGCSTRYTNSVVIKLTGIKPSTGLA